LVADRLLEQLPLPWRTAVRDLVLERTPHGGQRWRLCDRRGEVLAFASAESALPPAALPPQILTQRRIAECEIGGRRYTVRAFLPGQPLDRALRRAPASADALLEAACQLLGQMQAGSAARERIDAAAWSRQIETPAAIVRHAPLAAAAEVASLDALVQQLEPLRQAHLVCALHHGDFQFGNLIREQSGAIGVIDWELSLGRAPLLMDLFHLLIASVVERGLAYDAAAEVLAQDLAHGDSKPANCLHRHAERFGVPPAEWGWHAALSVLHGMSHFVRRVPHLADGPRIAGFLRAADVLRLALPG
jgi:aminoglycoside phosphotransferase (APT) family kinase protein